MVGLEDVGEDVQDDTSLEVPHALHISSSVAEAPSSDPE